jgi:hypothetical protein
MQSYWVSVNKCSDCEVNSKLLKRCRGLMHKDVLSTRMTGNFKLPMWMWIFLKSLIVDSLHVLIFNLYSGGVESNWVHSALRPPIGLLFQPRVIMMIEKLVEWFAGETEVLGKNLPQCRFVHPKPYMLPGREPGPLRLEASDISLCRKDYVITSCRMVKTSFRFSIY